jgi:hypothetical protein
VLLTLLVALGFVLGQFTAWFAGNTEAWNEARERAYLVYLGGACSAAFRTADDIAAGILEAQGGKLSPTALRFASARKTAGEVIRSLARSLPLSVEAGTSDLCARGIQPWLIRPRY